MDIETAALLIKCFERADRLTDGHFTLCKFTVEWRAGFLTPNSYWDIQAMDKGDDLRVLLDRVVNLGIPDYTAKATALKEVFEREVRIDRIYKETPKIRL